MPTSNYYITYIYKDCLNKISEKTDKKSDSIQENFQLQWRRLVDHKPINTWIFTRTQHHAHRTKTKTRPSNLETSPTKAASLYPGSIVTHSGPCVFSGVMTSRSSRLYRCPPRRGSAKVCDRLYVILGTDFEDENHLWGFGPPPTGGCIVGPLNLVVLGGPENRAGSENGREGRKVVGGLVFFPVTFPVS